MNYVEENPKGFRLMKYLRLGFYCGIPLLWAYITWIIRYSRHPERYPLEVRYAKTRKIVTSICKALHLDFQIERMPVFLDAKRPFLLVGNHLGADDVMNLIALSPKPISFIAKKEFEHVILVGRVIKILDGYFLDRDDPFQAARVFKDASKRMVAQNLPYVIFPEGTRNKLPFTTHVAEFRAGALKIAYWGKADIIPFSQFGTFRPLNKHYNQRSCLVQLKFFDPIPYGEYSVKTTAEFAPILRDLVDQGVEPMKEKDLSYKEKGLHKKKAPKWWKNPEVYRP